MAVIMITIELDIPENLQYSTFYITQFIFLHWSQFYKLLNTNTHFTIQERKSSTDRIALTPLK